MWGEFLNFHPLPFTGMLYFQQLFGVKKILDIINPLFYICFEDLANASILIMISKVSAKSERLHICVGFSCNNNCIFCMEEDRKGRYGRLIKQTKEDIKKMLDENISLKQVMFTSGEPTLHPELPAFIRMAKNMRYETIGLITNGRRLSYFSYCEILLKNGLNHILFSIHGHNEKTHDALTRTNGSFEQSINGIKNISILKKDYKIKVHTSSVVNKRNYKFFKEFFEKMKDYKIDQHIFNVMMPDGRGLRYFKQLMPSYREVTQEFKKFVDTLKDDEISKVYLLDIPYCTTENLPSSTRGYVERYFHYEGALLDGESIKYSILHKSSQDELMREKREECICCKYNSVCKGVWKEYILHYGWSEFVPVRKR